MYGEYTINLPLAPIVGIEPTSPGLEAGCVPSRTNRHLVEMTGVEPAIIPLPGRGTTPHGSHLDK